MSSINQALLIQDKAFFHPVPREGRGESNIMQLRNVINHAKLKLNALFKQCCLTFFPYQAEAIPAHFKVLLFEAGERHPHYFGE